MPEIIVAGWTLVLAIAGLVYAGHVLWAARGLKKAVVHGSGEDQNKKVRISVIIAARNEELCIGATLERVLDQTCPPDDYEVIVVNDASTDRTAAIVRDFQLKYRNLRMLTQDEECPYPSRKKWAIECGIRAARYEVLLFTDADCEVGPRWVESTAACYRRNPGAACVVGMVGFAASKHRHLAMDFQELEFIFLGTLGRGFVHNGHPISANGNNFSYTRTLFDTVGGFEGISAIKSGDDDLLLHKFAQLGSHAVVYNDDPDSVTFTAPEETMAGFLNQRSRWASKTFTYQDPVILSLVLGLFIFSVSVLLLPVMALLNPLALVPGLVFIGLRSVVDSLLVAPALRSLGRSRLLPLVGLAGILHCAYLVCVGLRGTFGRFEWKSGSFRGSESRVQAESRRVA